MDINGKNVLVTGGCGFIGSNFIHHLITNYNCNVIVVDCMNYAARFENLDPYFNDITFIRDDISDYQAMKNNITGVDLIVNFAAETHVDRSIINNQRFIESNVQGVNVLADLASKNEIQLCHISTDEVLGESTPDKPLDEFAPLAPRNPYSASKASAELLLRAFGETFGLNYIITRGANTYGPRQYPEKIIPLFIKNSLYGYSLPLYGDGSALRDYLYVEDHVSGICCAIEKGKNQEIYHISSGKLMNGNEIAEAVLKATGSKSQKQYVKDRPGHDMCYNISNAKICDLGWEPKWNLELGLKETIEWYNSSYNFDLQ